MKYYTKTNSADQDLAMDTYESSLENPAKNQTQNGSGHLQDSSRTVVN